MKMTKNGELDLLIERIRKDRNDCEASERLFSLFYPVMYSMVARRCPSAGSDFDEMLEILHIALLDAVFSYDEEKGSFATYAGSCMKNRLIDGLRSLKKGEESLLDPLGDELEALAAPEDPEGELVSRESYLSALAKAKEILSPFQYRVLFYESEGYSTAEIALKLATSPKQVDNAKYRTRRNKKIREIFQER